VSPPSPLHAPPHEKEHTTIQAAVTRVAAEITEAYKSTKTDATFTVVALLTGTFMFFADLVRQIDVPHQVRACFRFFALGV
jgi:hypoxanthine-guanine phosphoribosyltransferase